MASQLSKGHTYNSGDVVDAPDLNALVDDAVARVTGGLVSEQTPVAATPTDYVLISDTSDSNKLKKALVSSFGVGTVTSVGLTMPLPFIITMTPPGTPNPLVGSGTFGVAFRDQAAGKVLAGPVSGSDATPSFRVLAPTDIPIATVTIAATAIDWDLGNTFKKTLTANTTFTFTNANEGQTIRVGVIQDASHTVAWPAAVKWPGGTVPVMTTGAGHVDIYTFNKIGGVLYGTFTQNFS
jgi:hypothetical protein